LGYYGNCYESNSVINLKKWCVDDKRASNIYTQLQSFKKQRKRWKKKIDVIEKLHVSEWEGDPTIEKVMPLYLQRIIWGNQIYDLL